MATDDAPRLGVVVEKHDCGATLGYNERYDAYFCASCNVWTEVPCKSLPGECPFGCEVRPEKPSEVLE